MFITFHPENVSNQIRTSTCSSNKAKQLFPPFYAFEKGKPVLSAF